MQNDEQIQKGIVEAIEKHRGMILQSKLPQAVRHITKEDLTSESIHRCVGALIEKGTVVVVEQPQAWVKRESRKPDNAYYYKLVKK